MKKIIWMLMLLANFILLADVQVEKVNEFAYAKSFNNKNSLVSIGNYLYGLTEYGIEVYVINDDNSLENLNKVLIPNSSKIYEIDNKLYVITGHNFASNKEIKLLELTLDDPEIPIVSTEINTNMCGISKYIEFCGNCFYIEISSDGNNTTSNRLISYPELEVIGSSGINLSNFYKINNTYMLNKNGYLYNVTNPQFWTIDAFWDLSECDEYGTATSFTTYQDTILVTANNRKVAFWNISDIGAIQYLSDFTLNEYYSINSVKTLADRRVLLLSGLSLAILDISDINNPVFVLGESGETAEYFFNKSSSFIEYGSAYYVSSSNHGIIRIEIDGEQIMFNIDDSSLTNLYKAHISEDKITIGNSKFDFRQYNLTDPVAPALCNVFDNQLETSFYQLFDDHIVLKDFESLVYRIYDNPNSGNINYLGELNPDIEFLKFVRQNMYINQDASVIYLNNYGKIRKYDATNINDLVPEWDYEMYSSCKICLTFFIFNIEV